jgi:hypothetical protein
MGYSEFFPGITRVKLGEVKRSPVKARILLRHTRALYTQTISVIPIQNY